MIRGRLDLAVLFTPYTPNRQNRNQVCWNICAGVRRSTPSFEVVQTEQSRDLFQKKMADHCLHVRKYFVSLDLFRSTPKCPVLLVFVAVLAYAEYSKNCLIKSAPGITGVEVGVTPIILSGTILKWLFAVILTFEIVILKSALKNRYDSAKIGMVGICAGRR